MDLELRQLFRLARRRWWLLILAPLVTGAAAFAFSSRQQPLYQATATLMVDPAQGVAPPDYNAILGSQILAETYQQLITTDPVLAPVMAELGLPYGVDELRDRVSASQVRNTLLLQVSVSDPDPVRAASIADAIARQFVDFVAAAADQRAGAMRAELDEQVADTRRQVEEIERQIERLEQGGQAGADLGAQDELESLRATRDRLVEIYSGLVETAQAMDLNTAAARAQITIPTPAGIPSAPYTPRVALTTLIGVIAGLLVGVGAVGLLQYLSKADEAGPDRIVPAGTASSASGTSAASPGT